MEALGFWSYAVRMVPLYILATLVALYFLKRWLDDRGSFLQAVLFSGLFSTLALAVAEPLQLRAMAELGPAKFMLLSFVDLLLWAVGLVAFFLVRAKALDLADHFRAKVGW